MRDFEQDPGKIVLGMVAFLGLFVALLFLFVTPQEQSPYRVGPGVVYFPDPERVCFLTGENTLFKNPEADCLEMTDLPGEQQAAVRAKVAEITARNQRPAPIVRFVNWCLRTTAGEDPSSNPLL